MVKRPRKKPRTNRTAFWVIILIAIGSSLAWWYLFHSRNVSPEFNFILLKKNEHILKLLNGEVLHLHPRDRLKILKISTTIHFNRGVRIISSGFDVNALLNEEMSLSKLLPDKDIFGRYTFRVKVKKYNHDLGHVDISVEPFVEDWLEKADRTIDKSKKIATLERALKFAPDENQIRDRLIEEYKTSEKWSQAAPMLEEIARKRPGQKVLYDLLEVYEAMSRKDEVISVLRRLVKEDPDDLQVRLKLASCLEEAKNIKDAIKEYEKILKGMGKWETLSVCKTLGYLYTETGQIKKAISNYLQAVGLDSKDANLYYNLSSLYERIGDRERADSFLSKAVNLKTGDMEGRVVLAERLIGKGKLKEAEKHLSEVLEKGPDSVRALLLMINIMEKRGDKRKLIDFYQRIHFLEPENETIFYNLGVLEYETGNLAASLSYFKKFMESHPDDAEIHTFLFDIYRKQKKHDLAFKEAQVLLKLMPKEINPYYYIFEYLNSKDKFKKMIEIMKNGIKSHPKNIDLRKYLILAYLKTDKEDLATAQIKKVLKIRPKDKTMLLKLARLEEKKGKIEEASNTYKKILVLLPGHKEAREAYLRLLLRLANLKEKEGNIEESLKAFEKILDISPDHKEARKANLRLLLKLARIEEKQGNLKKAIEVYQKIMDISPGHEEAEEAYLRLRFKVLPVE